MNPSTLLSTVALVALLSASAFGHIGETFQQCFDRYGRKIIEEKNFGLLDQITFHSDDLTVTALFVDGKAEYLTFEKEGRLSDIEVSHLLENNSVDSLLTQESRRPVQVGDKVLDEVTWNSLENVAVLNPTRNSLIVYTKRLADQ
jgi:hypothetical protein